MSTFSRLSRFFSRLLRPQRGFTLIELLVVSLIIVLITAFVLFRQQGFNSSTLLRSLSYSVALSVRQAQVYGVSVRESGAGTGKFAQGYGVLFSNNGCSLGNTSRYQLFADIEVPGVRTANGVMDSGEELPCFTIGNGRGTDYKMSDFCAHTILSNTTVCNSQSGAITSLTVYFRRPNPDACFSTSQSPGACATATTQTVYDYAYVQLKSAAGADYRTIKITNTGQIAVCKPNLDAAGIAAC